MRILGWIGGIFVVLMVIGAYFVRNHPQGSADTEPVSTAQNQSEPSIADQAQPSVSQSHWRYSQSVDEMRGKATKFACTNSDNELQFDFPYGGGVVGELCLRIDPKFGKDVILSVNNGQFVCSVLGCTVSAKFDGGAIQTFSAGEAADGSTGVIFIRNYGRFLSALRKAQHVIIEADFFQEGRRQLKFTVEHLDWK